jgi:hypothetical protein
LCLVQIVTLTGVELGVGRINVYVLEPELNINYFQHQLEV